MESMLRRRREPVITREEVRGIIVELMDMDSKLDRVLELLEDDDGWAEEEETRS